MIGKKAKSILIILLSFSVLIFLVSSAVTPKNPKGKAPVKVFKEGNSAEILFKYEGHTVALYTVENCEYIWIEGPRKSAVVHHESCKNPKHD